MLRAAPEYNELRSCYSFQLAFRLSTGKKSIQKLWLYADSDEEVHNRVMQLVKEQSEAGLKVFFLITSVQKLEKAIRL